MDSVLFILHYRYILRQACEGMLDFNLTWTNYRIIYIIHVYRHVYYVVQICCANFIRIH